ncbi:MAG TPA: hypothetical protein VKG05_08320, partial [Steroidobacteraceae bacterium]|nr:hypothetical protein [Steroidobacteraceae bacterium]
MQNRSGVNFALYSGHATRVEVCIYDAATGAETARYDLARTGETWHGLLSPRRASAGTHYAFCVHGPYEPEQGHRFDAKIP